MYYQLRILKDNIIIFQTEFDRQRQVDIEKLKKEYRDKYPEPEYKLEVN